MNLSSCSAGANRRGASDEEFGPRRRYDGRRSEREEDDGWKRPDPERSKKYRLRLEDLQFEIFLRGILRTLWDIDRLLRPMLSELHKKSQCTVILQLPGVMNPGEELKMVTAKSPLVLSILRVMAYEFMWTPNCAARGAKEGARDLMERVSLSVKADRDWITDAMIRMGEAFEKAHNDWDKKHAAAKEKKRRQRADKAARAAGGGDCTFEDLAAGGAKVKLAENAKAKAARKREGEDPRAKRKGADAHFGNARALAAKEQALGKADQAADSQKSARGNSAAVRSSVVRPAAAHEDEDHEDEDGDGHGAGGNQGTLETAVVSNAPVRMADEEVDEDAGDEEDAEPDVEGEEPEAAEREVEDAEEDAEAKDAGVAEAEATPVEPEETALQRFINGLPFSSFNSDSCLPARKMGKRTLTLQTTVSNVKRQHEERPWSFKPPSEAGGRPDTMDLPSLARYAMAERLVERALGLGVGLQEVSRKCAAIYYRECHFQALCLHDMSQGLVLMSGVAVPDTCSGALVLRCLNELLQRALLPVGRRWTAIKKLEAQAVSMRLLAADSLQISALQVLNRLCRVHPQACEAFRDVALQCTDSFHLSHRQSSGAFNPWSSGAEGDRGFNVLAPTGGNGNAFNVLAPGGSLQDSRVPGAGRHDNTMLYAEILDLVATICSRGSLQNASLVCQKILSHSNQWFNWSFARAPPPHGGSSFSASDAVTLALCRLVSGACGSRLLVVQPTVQPIAQSLNSGMASSMGDPWGRAENIGNLLVELLTTHPEPSIKAACLGALGNLDLPPPQVSRMILSSVLAAVPSLVPFLEQPKACDGAVAIELLACTLRFLQAVPINKGRYALDLQPFTHVVIHQVLLKTLAEPSAFSSARYWRLAALTLRWLRLVLRGPLPMSSSAALNTLIVRPYSDSEATAAEVYGRCAAGNATAYAFRCLLSLDSPVFARVLNLTLLQGRSVDGLANRRKGVRPRMETEAFDAQSGHRHNPSYLALLSEFLCARLHHGVGRLALYVFMQCAFREPQRVLRLLQLEPWRLQAISTAIHDKIVQPGVSLKFMNQGLETGESPPRLDTEEATEEVGAAAKSQGTTWDKHSEACFAHEAMEIDASPDGLSHLDMASFETSLPICRSVDLLQQLAEDSVVQAADMAVWARGSSAEGSDAGVATLRGCASSDSATFRAAYLRGFDIPTDWLSAGAAAMMATLNDEHMVQLPFAALATESSRLLTLRLFVLSSLSTMLRRILLSEAALILQVCSWEMRLVWPAGRPPNKQLERADLVGQQLLDLKMNVSEHLQEVVSDLVSSQDAGWSAHTATPYLVGTALRLADACDVIDAVDPFVLLHLSGLSFQLSATESEGDRSRFTEDLQQLGSRNEYACIAFYTEQACKSLATFASAALCHLVGRPPAMGNASSASDCRAQARCFRNLEEARPRREEAVLLSLMHYLFPQATLLLLQRMLPDPAMEAAQGLQPAELELQDLEDLAKLLTSLMAAAVAEVETVEESAQGVALPLMCALMTRLWRLNSSSKAEAELMAVEATVRPMVQGSLQPSSEVQQGGGAGASGAADQGHFPAQKVALYELLLRQLQDDGFEAEVQALTSQLHLHANNQVEKDALLDIYTKSWTLCGWAKNNGHVSTWCPLLGHKRRFSTLRECRFQQVLLRLQILARNLRKSGCCTQLHTSHTVVLWPFRPMGDSVLQAAQMVASNFWTPRKCESARRALRDQSVACDHIQGVSCLAFHPTNPTLFSGSSDKAVKIFDLTRPPGHKKAFSVLQDVYAVNSICIHPCGDFLFVGTAHQAVRMYDLQTLSCFTSSHQDQHHSAGDFDILATASADGSIKLWDAVNNSVVNALPQAHSGSSVTSVRWSRSLRYLLSSGNDGRHRLWDVRMGKEVFCMGFGPRSADFGTAAFVNGEKYIAAANSNVRLSDVSLFDSTTGAGAQFAAQGQQLDNESLFNLVRQLQDRDQHDWCEAAGQRVQQHPANPQVTQERKQRQVFVSRRSLCLSEELMMIQNLLSSHWSRSFSKPAFTADQSMNPPGSHNIMPSSCEPVFMHRLLKDFFGACILLPGSFVHVSPNP
eukprot:g9279.t1